MVVNTLVVLSEPIAWMKRRFKATRKQRADCSSWCPAALTVNDNVDRLFPLRLTAAAHEAQDCPANSERAPKKATSATATFARHMLEGGGQWQTG